MRKEKKENDHGVLYENLFEDMKSEEEVKALDKKQKNRLLKIRISFVALIIISAITYFYDSYLYNREAEKMEEMKKQAKIEKPIEKEAPVVVQERPTPEPKTEEGTKEKEAVVPEEPPYVSPIDFEYWKNINPDVIGYIYAPDTKIDYPILYDEQDNERYLHESIDGKTTIHGSIYLDNLAKKDFSSRNNLIYGHNMRDGSMFKDVVKYKDFEYLKKHKTVYIYTPDREIKLKAIAAFYGNPDGSSRQTIFIDNDEFGDFVKRRLSLAPKTLKLPDGDATRVTQLFCLVTCSYEFDNARTFLYCIKESDYEEKADLQTEEESKADIRPVDNIVDSGLVIGRY